MATELSPPKKKKAKGPQILRKKLHWVPIRVSGGAGKREEGRRVGRGRRG